MAHVMVSHGSRTLVMSHNKTLAAQLYGEFKASGGVVVEQISRPRELVDPDVEVRPVDEGRRQGGHGRRTIVVTGGSGFIGRHVVQHLVMKGYAVRVLVRNPNAPVVEGPGFLEIHSYDGLADAEGLGHAFRGADAVIHLAARAHVMRETDEDPLVAFRRVNVEGTRSVLAAAHNCGVEHLIFLSSVKAVAEASPPTAPLNPLTEPHPSDPYGISKLEAEQLLEQSAQDGEVAVTVLRPPLVYGPGLGGNMLRLFQLVSRGVPLPFRGVKNRRSLLYVGNLTLAIACLLDSHASGYRRFFVSDLTDLSTPDIIELTGKALSRPARLITVPDALLEFSGRLGDMLNRIVPFPLSSGILQRLTGSLVVDSKPLWSECGISPPFTPCEGFLATGTWFREASQGLLRP